MARGLVGNLGGPECMTAKAGSNIGSRNLLKSSRWPSRGFRSWTITCTCWCGSIRTWPRAGRILEGFSLGNYLLLVEYTGRLFREGKAVSPVSWPGSSSGWGATPRTGRRGCGSWPRAGCWAVSSPPAEPGCGKSPSVWACTTWRTWAAARRDDAAPKAAFHGRLHFTLPETIARFRRSCRKLNMSGSCGESLAIRCDQKARVPPTPQGGTRACFRRYGETWPPDVPILQGL